MWLSPLWPLEPPQSSSEKNRLVQEALIHYGRLREVIVSICCITYNHEKYIKEALEGFLMQKTKFRYEILIHDDASTDQTPFIIKEYERKHPAIIKPIYQNENKYSKEKRIDSIYNWSRSQGKYIATCEGDDYWTDPYKLQKQVDFMEKYTQCVYCCHATQRIYENGKPQNFIIRPNKNKKFFTTEEIIYEEFGPICQTSSVLFNKSLAKILPKYFFDAPQGDYAFRIFCSTQGFIGYIDEVMSVYRHHAKGSWTESLKRSKSKRLRNCLETIELLNSINDYTDYRFNSSVKKQINIIEKSLLKSKENRSCLKDPYMYEIFNQFTVGEKAKQYLRWYAPKIYNYISQTRAKIGRYG